MPDYSNGFFITHIESSKTPEKGLLKLHFFTSTHKEIEKKNYFYGKGNNSYSQKNMDRFVKKGIIFELQEPIEITESQKALWLSSKGELIIADIKDPIADINGRCVGFLAHLIKEASPS